MVLSRSPIGYLQQRFSKTGETPIPQEYLEKSIVGSYVLWEEDGIAPIWVLEVVSQTYNSEYEQKKLDYANLGVLYYAIYAPTRLRRKRQRLEVYRLVEGKYVLISGEKIWMPEIGLGIGRERGIYQGLTREWLYWKD